MKSLLFLALLSVGFAQSLPTDPPFPPAPSVTSSPNHKACYAAAVFWRDQAYALRTQIASGTPVIAIPQPTELTATIVGTIATLTWKYDSISPTISGFRLERSDGGPDGFRVIAILGVGIRTATDKTLNSGQTYSYRLDAYLHSFAKSSDSSNVATITTQ